MRIAAWNLNHRTLEKKIPPRAIDGIRQLNADVLILTEFVDGYTREAFRNSLNEIGYLNISVSSRIANHNQVLIASRSQQVSGDLISPDTTDAAVSNFLHRIFPTEDLEIVGVRPPAYKTRAELKNYWQQLSIIIEKAQERAIIFIGDLNCDPAHRNSPGSLALQNLCSLGFKIPDPVGPWSYVSHDGKQTSRIDHAVVSPRISCCTASYIYRFGNVVLAGPKHEEPISDHAVLVLDAQRYGDQVK